MPNNPYIRIKNTMYRRKSLIWFWISIAILLPAVPLLVESIIQSIVSPRGLGHVILLYLSILLHIGFLLATAISTWYGIRAYINEKNLAWWLVVLYAVIVFMLFQYEILAL